MKDITPILGSLGLIDSEIKIYLTALESGPSTAADLAKATGLSRQATYVAIESLNSRGLMSSALHGKKRLFAAEPPAKLAACAKRRDAEMHEKVRELEEVLPELELRAGGEKPLVRLFEGKQGIFAIIEDMRATKAKQSVEMTDLDAMYKVLNTEDLRAMRDELKKFGTEVRGLYSGKASPKTVEGRRVFLPVEFGGFKANIGIYGDRVALVTFEGKMHSVIIESAALTKAMRTLFKLAFRGAAGLPEEK
jgi:sugar-specific transcriptional regulator TrmB